MKLFIDTNVILEYFIRRVKRCKRVVVELDGLATVAIAFVPAILLKEIN